MSINFSAGENLMIERLQQISNFLTFSCLFLFACCLSVSVCLSVFDQLFVNKLSSCSYYKMSSAMVVETKIKFQQCHSKDKNIYLVLLVLHNMKYIALRVYLKSGCFEFCNLSKSHIREIVP